MRVLLLSQFYPPEVGGVETHVRALARGLASHGHDVAVATLSPSALSEAKTAEEDSSASGSEPRVHRLSGSAQRIGLLYTTDRRHAPPVPDPELVVALRRLVAELRPDVVHAHNWMGRSFLPLKGFSGAKYVVTLHDCGVTCAQGRMMQDGERLCSGPRATKCLACCSHFYGRLKGPITAVGNRLMRGPESRAVDAYIAVSSAIAQANGLTSSGLHHEVIPNFAVDQPKTPPAADPRLNLLPDSPFILQVGDVAADKGVEVAFEAYSRLESPPPLVLIGRVVADVADRVPDGVALMGRWPHELIGEAWRRSMFGIVPSLCLDASPTVTLEAMAASKPIVASALGGLTDQVVDGVTGLLVAPGDVEALRAAMARLVGDSGLRQAMGAAGRARYDECFRSDVVIDRIERLYEGLLATTPGVSP